MGNDVFGRGKIVFVTPSFPTMRQLVRENSGVFMRGAFRLILVAFDEMFVSHVTKREFGERK
jgi:hypothetical protein